MEIAVHLISLVLVVWGVALMVASRKHRTDAGKTAPDLDIRKSRRIWEVKHLYTPEGYRKGLIGVIMLTVGSLLRLLIRLFQ